MALIQCPDCGTSVSDAAVACPNCARPIASAAANHKKKVAKTNPSTGGCLGAIILICFGVVLIHSIFSSDDSSSSSNNSSTQAQQSPTPSESAQSASAATVHPSAQSAASSSDDPLDPKPDAKCRADLQCMSDKFNAFASVDCKEPIESRAQHDVKWSDGFLTPMFEKIGWANDSHTQIRYIGDKAEFQNGFGAYTPVTYTCIFDTSAKKVVDVSVFEGRINDAGNAEPSEGDAGDASQ